MLSNQQNLLYMLATGMVTAPDGFSGDKYYDDLLGEKPGWVPFFRSDGTLPRGAIERVTRSEAFLKPCIATFNLAGLGGMKGERMLPNGQLKKVGIATSRKSKDELAVFVPLPLPIAWLETIAFRTVEDQQDLEDLAADVSNVCLDGIELETRPEYFTSDNGHDWPASQQQLTGGEGNSYSTHAQAMGGTLAMLYHTANRSDLAIAAFRMASGQSKASDRSALAKHPILAHLSGWLEQDHASEPQELGPRIFWGVAEQLSGPYEVGEDSGPMDAILSWLQKEQDSAGDDRLGQLISDMRSCFGLGGGTISDLFEHHRGPLSRALLLLCLRDNCGALLEFSHPLMNDIDHVAAAILFGIRDSWLRLPARLRTPQLNAYVTTRMAALGRSDLPAAFHREASAPQPLRTLLRRGNTGWSTTQQQAALALVKAHGWIDCVSTRIRLPSADYTGQPQRDAGHLTFPGWLIAEDPQIDMEAVLRRLSDQPFPDSTADSRIRQLLERGSS